MAEKTVCLAQCLCGPNRHTIITAASEIDESDKATGIANLVTSLRQTIYELLGRHVINPRCGICGSESGHWHIEAQPIDYASIDEAFPDLARVEAENIAASLIFGSHGPGKQTIH